VKSLGIIKSNSMAKRKAFLLNQSKKQCALLYENRLMKYVLVFIAFWISTPSVKSMGQTLSKPDARILLIPLDDRPPCLQFPVKMDFKFKNRPHSSNKRRNENSPEMVYASQAF